MSGWQFTVRDNRLMFICDDFENDAALTLTGDFGDEDDIDRFAQSLLARLNTRATDAELERLRADLARVTAERNRLLADLDDRQRIIDRQADLLTGVANALRGEPEPLHAHSWHDLPERARAVVAEREALREALAQIAAHTRFNADIAISMCEQARAALNGEG